MRHLKYHEQKLLKKVSLYDWKDENNHAEHAIIERFQLKDRNEYVKYRRLISSTRAFVEKLKVMPTNDPVRIELTQKLLEKLYHIGILPQRDSTLLDAIECLTTANICKRRLASIMKSSKMVQSMPQAVTFIKDGHVTIGPKVVTDPAILVTRNFEDHVTWSANSKVRKNIAKFNEKHDDYAFTR